ncbi:hypothetical protein Ppro_1895 [Pelobacter propionicus DSM 2379]|uniref:Uncharacterized protein n=1 Tax=Pelobacter propionicus (strain DSM 2379 / NBRC 103807 / OttBd1) TaxID=338966 RepID=A1AQ85_PELPD|nr:hypothetical protein Ppro_1895 [Pelobacter propionicus DSM 2379]
MMSTIMTCSSQSSSTVSTNPDVTNRNTKTVNNLVEVLFKLKEKRNGKSMFRMWGIVGFQNWRCCWLEFRRATYDSNLCLQRI